MGEIVAYWACEADNADVWAIHNRDDLFIRVRSERLDGSFTIATVILLFNDLEYNLHPDLTVELLTKSSLIPDVIAVGSCNAGWGVSQNVRMAVYTKSFPQTKILKLPPEPIPHNCEADFKNCKASSGHQCIPGPMARAVETVAGDLIRAATAIASV